MLLLRSCDAFISEAIEICGTKIMICCFMLPPGLFCHTSQWGRHSSEGICQSAKTI